MEENNNYTNSYSEYDRNKEVMTMGEWFITLIVLTIPCVNIIMYFVWAFGDGNENRKNFCKVSLILGAVSLVLGALVAFATGTPLWELY